MGNLTCKQEYLNELLKLLTLHCGCFSLKAKTKFSRGVTRRAYGGEYKDIKESSDFCYMSISGIN